MRVAASDAVPVSEGLSKTGAARSTKEGYFTPERQVSDTPYSEIARRAGLTPRESDVFELLARGWSRPYIGEALSLSSNTVASYTKRVYSKLNVHSKQQLIDLVELYKQ
jgi:DNA-binding NarL/FixJ family response regulator